MGWRRPKPPYAPRYESAPGWEDRQKAVTQLLTEMREVGDDTHLGKQALAKALNRIALCLKVRAEGIHRGEA